MQKGNKGVVLVTGGSGFIGSHTIVELVNNGYSVITLDNLSNSSIKCIERIEKIINEKLLFYEVNLLDKKAVDDIFEKHKIDYVIHFAALKSVSESIEKPIQYYNNNLVGILNLLQAMIAHNVKNFVLSSSATVYGEPQFLPLTEKHPTGNCQNSYGNTKLCCELILKDLYTSDPTWNIISLRYFNPVGAHASGLIGEDPRGIPNNLMPYVTQVASGLLPYVNVYGNDYPTVDGTEAIEDIQIVKIAFFNVYSQNRCVIGLTLLANEHPEEITSTLPLSYSVRDYIHVVDLAEAHTKSLDKIKQNCGFKVYNLGTGQGCSVLQMIQAMETASGKTIPYTICSRRPGDCATVYSDASLAQQELGWKAKYNIDKMCEDLWNWQVKNPQGYLTSTHSNN
uniref:UDP-glucose 4-epimerase n=1 Tax=Schistosoma haematobium TaxID=6185 RepID=A0A095AQH9_SCHHA